MPGVFPLNHGPSTRITLPERRRMEVFIKQQGWACVSTSITTTSSDPILHLTFTRLSRRPLLAQDRCCVTNASTD